MQWVANKGTTEREGDAKEAGCMGRANKNLRGKHGSRDYLKHGYTDVLPKSSNTDPVPKSSNHVTAPAL